jgi:hypothetical protein
MHAVAGTPSVFISWGTNDLDYVLSQGPIFQEYFNQVGIEHTACEIQNASHFYPRSVLVNDSSGFSGSFEESLARFLKAALKIN